MKKKSLLLKTTHQEGKKKKKKTHQTDLGTHGGLKIYIEELIA